MPRRSRNTVRCCDCRHRIQSQHHPVLGWCGAGRKPGGAAGWWSTDPIYCELFEAKEVA